MISHLTTSLTGALAHAAQDIPGSMPAIESGCPRPGCAYDVNVLPKRGKMSHTVNASQ